MTGKAPIRLKVRAIVCRGSDVLLSFAIDPVTGVRYGRFLGGAIEFGERADVPDAALGERGKERLFEVGVQRCR